MHIMKKVSEVMFAISSIVAAVALVGVLSGAWLEYVPYVNKVIIFASPIFWRSLASMLWWWILRGLFTRLSDRQDRKYIKSLIED